MTVEIRSIKVSDAADFLTLCRQLDEETTFMLLEPGERTASVGEQETRLLAVESRDNEVIFVAEDNGRLVGYVAGLGGRYRRNRHKASVVIGILQTYTGQGLGTRLLSSLEQWAVEKGLHKLELTVMAHNRRAIALYQKMGFVVEGISVDSLLVDGRFVDELDMAKLLA